MTTSLTYSAKNKKIIVNAMATALTLGAVLHSYAALNIPDNPLQANVSADPNVMMILDDSGSMQFEVMPDSTYVYFTFPRPSTLYSAPWGYGSDYNTVARFESTNRYARYFRTAQFNPLYYNPRKRYTPWANPDGSLMNNSKPTEACHNPNKCPALTTGSTSEGFLDLTTNKTWNVSWRNDDGSETSTSRTYYPATFFLYKGTATLSGPDSASNTSANFTLYEIKSANAPFKYTNATDRTDCTVTASSGEASCTYTQEIQNFANWYTYYRSRILTSRAGIGRAFSAQGTGLRVGFAAINQGSTSIDGESTNTLIRGVRQFSDTSTTTYRSDFFKEIYGHPMPSAGTPLRQALDDVGKYYQRADALGPWSSTPGVSGGAEYACRQSYAILMTDGYWNGNAASTEANKDNDSTSATTSITGPNNQSYKYVATSPFKDGRSGTLADVASYYWKTDLRNLPNAVPTSVRDPAFWQHMVTFGVGLGLNGSIDPDQAFNAIGNTASIITWPDPNGSDSAKLDDLLHAAVNGRGGFFSAKDPDEFASALTAMLSEIVDRKSSSGSVSANSTRLTTSSLVFSGSFNTADWGGELTAYKITSSGVTSTPAWEASKLIPAHGSRKIFTISGGNKREFLWSNLSGTDQTALVSQDILNYLRGDQSKETTNGGTLRKRKALLGDIVNSSPVYQKSTKTVYVGANDGMLHAFSTDTGIERFAYIPSPMLATAKQLSESTYTHKFFVDGDMEVVDKADTALSSSYLIGTLGRGGKGLYALDITSPASFAASNIAWEYVNTSDTNLGYMLGKPIYARMNDGSRVVIVGNGYNSTSGTAALYIFNLETGTVLKKIDTEIGSDNGLATPGVFDQNGDGYIDYIYAGDLKGNVWKFDVSSSNVADWTNSLFFTAKDTSNNAQPITAPISIEVNYLASDPNAGKRFLFFGTGAYFRKTDPDDKSVQTWYGLIDNGSAISGRSLLRKGSLASELTADGYPARTFSTASAKDMAGKSGWYIDWINVDGTKVGERMVTESVLYRLSEPTLLGSSIIPKADDPCQPGGTGYINAINAFTGGSLTKSIFVFSNSPGSSVVGSLDLGIGMPSQASLFVGDSSTGQIVVSGTGEGTSDVKPKSNPFTPGDSGGRIYWREINRK